MPPIDEAAGRPDRNEFNIETKLQSSYFERVPM